MSLPQKVSNSTVISVTVQGVKILGTPIGLSSYIIQSCSDYASSGNALCAQLHLLDDSQGALLILRCCHVPWPEL